MKEVLLQYATFNLWANQKIIDTILSASEDLHNKIVVSSFSSLRLTLAHMLMAERAWLKRIRSEEIIQPVVNENLSTREISAGLLVQSKEWVNWVEKSEEIKLEIELEYLNFRKEAFKQPVFQILVHVFNHSTYHRGQLVTMLRQLGVDNIPATDFIVWSRGKIVT